MCPVYDYFCDCGLEWEEYNDVANRDSEMCQCGKQAQRRFKLNAKPVVMEYFSENLNAQITGPRQKSQVMKRLNVSEVGRVS
jgi:hypothetical protein